MSDEQAQQPQPTEQVHVDDPETPASFSKGFERGERAIWPGVGHKGAAISVTVTGLDQGGDYVQVDNKTWVDEDELMVDDYERWEHRGERE